MGSEMCIRDSVKAVTAGVATLEEFNTSDTNKYPGGAATGNVSVISDWVELPCIQDLGKDGNEQRSITISALAMSASNPSLLTSRR